jgi:hypothetical protein
MIRATCRTCGTVDVPLSGARLLMSLDDRDPQSVVEFDCEHCGAAVSQRVNERATRLLSTAGIQLVAAPPTSEAMRREGDVL